MILPAYVGNASAIRVPYEIRVETYRRDVIQQDASIYRYLSLYIVIILIVILLVAMLRHPEIDSDLRAGLSARIRTSGVHAAADARCRHSLVVGVP